MSVNLKKFKFVSWGVSHLIWKRDKMRKKNINMLKLWTRGSYSDSMGAVKSYVIHKGNRWIKVKNSKLKNRFKLGEFAFTKKPFYHPIYKKRK